MAWWLEVHEQRLETTGEYTHLEQTKPTIDIENSQVLTMESWLIIVP